MIPVIAIFDIGRTHKKFMLFDESYVMVEETSKVIPDVRDEDGHTCEDLDTISVWLSESIREVFQIKKYEIRGINFSAHGASFVHLDENGNRVFPMYDYMKPLPEDVTDGFYNLFGSRHAFSAATGSPALNMLNSGVQLYWLQKKNSGVFKKINVSLHLPQYAHFVFSGKHCADITSIGCHTGLWDFAEKKYHRWLTEQGLRSLLPEAKSPYAYEKVNIGGKDITVGIGLHDSTAVLIPFMNNAETNFIFLSTGTWNIALNPFFDGDLKESDYNRDCLYYMLDIDRKVAASRVFLGNEFQCQVKKLEAAFRKQAGFHLNVVPDPDTLKKVLNDQTPDLLFYPEGMAGTGPYPDLKYKETDLSRFGSYEEAYHKLLLDLTYLQQASIRLINGGIKRLYVSGGFVQNSLFMELLQGFLPDWEIYIAENKRASALGAAIIMHDLWQQKPISKSVSPVISFESKFRFDLHNYRSFFDESDIQSFN